MKIVRENKKIEKEVLVTIYIIQYYITELMNKENVLKKIRIEYYEQSAYQLKTE